MGIQGTVTRPNIVLTKSLSEAKFSSISRSMERFMRIVSASLAICWGFLVVVLEATNTRTDFVISYQHLQILYWQKLVRFEYCGLGEGVGDEVFDSCGGVRPCLLKRREELTKLSHLGIAMGYEINELQAMSATASSNVARILPLLNV